LSEPSNVCMAVCGSFVVKFVLRKFIKVLRLLQEKDFIPTIYPVEIAQKILDFHWLYGKNGL
ncbi:MAG: hypothetical protein II075_04780, partial [Bacteroidales bacterium]|nr:hypothetical protein [Bacteroidales bacterium]